MAEVAWWKQKKQDFIFRKLIFPVLFGILFILHLNALFLVKSLFVSRGVQTNFKTLLISISFKNLQFTKPRLPDHVITIIQKSTFPHKFVWLTRKVSLSEYWFTFSSITSFNQLDIKTFVSTFLVAKFWGYSNIKLMNFKTCLWTCNLCHIGSEHTRW